MVFKILWLFKKSFHQQEIHNLSRLYSLVSRNTNKMQFYSRIYYSKVYWRLNMFRAAHRSSSWALNCICSIWLICPYGDRSLPRLSGHCSAHSALATTGQLQIQFRTPDDERCAASKHVEPLKKLWNNKFYYKTVSCWYSYWDTTLLRRVGSYLPTDMA